MFSKAKISHLPMFREEQPVNCKMVIQNPRALYRRMIRLSDFDIKKTILYLGNEFNEMDTLFRILDKTLEVRDNAIFVR